MTGSSGWNGGEPAGDRSRETLEDLVQTRTDELHQLADALTDALLRVTDDGTITFANDAVEGLLGYDPETLRGQSVGSLLAEAPVGPVPAQTFETLCEQATGSSDQAVPLLAADGTGVVVSISAVPLEETAGYILLARDTGQGDQHERRPYAELVETVGDPMYVLDEAGDIERINDAMVEYTGYDRDELVGRSMSEIVPAHEYDRATNHLAALASANGSETTTFETALVTNGGDLVISEAKVTALTDDDGEFAGSVGVLRDIRDRKQRERDLELLKQVLTRVFRHNVRNDLTLIQGHTDLIDQLTDAAVDEHTQKIRQTCEGLLEHSEKARLIEGVIETDKRHEIPLQSHVEQIVEAFRAEFPDAQFEVDLPDSLTVEAHPKLPTAVEELVDNALRHAPADETPVVSLWADQTDDAVTLFVEDESGGLSEHEIEVLRRGMETDLKHSSGVGLWLVRWVVEASGADMIAHRTDDGSLMGIKFTQREEPTPGSGSPLTRLPGHLTESVTPVRLRDETVVGQVDELRQLETIYDDLPQRGGHTVFVTGETGVGKSTLLDQFASRLADRETPPLVARGSCESGVTRPYDAIRQLLADLPELTADFDTVAFEQDDPDDPEMVKRRRQALFADLADQLRTLSTDQPVVLLLDDFQRADRATLDLLSYLVDEVGRWALPILFVVTYRTDAVDPDHPVVELADRTAETPRGQRMPLGPFDPEDVRNLLTFMLDTETIPDSLVDAIHEHTGGNPLFVTEIGRQLAETVGPESTRADLPASVAELSLPASVESAVTDRIDELEPPVRGVLQLGAVVGKSISLDVLRTASDLTETELLEHVETLVNRRLWERSSGTLAFVHGVIRTKTLATIDPERRERLHARIADAIETVYADSLDEQYGQLAMHWEAAGEYERALTCARQAGERAVDAYAHETAIEHDERVLDIADHIEVDTETVVTAGLRLAESYLTVNNYDAAEEYITFVRERTPTARPEWRCRSAQLAAQLAIQRGDYETAIAEAETGMAVADEHSVVYCRLLDTRGEAEWRKSDYEAAESTAERLRELAGELDRPDLAARANEQLARVYQERAEYDRARDHYRTTLDRAQTAGDPHLEVDARTGLGVVADRQSIHDQARTQFEQALAVAESVGDHHQAARIYNNLANLAYQKGNLTQAQEYYERVLETGERVGDDELVSVVCFNLGSMVRQHSEFDRAREYTDAALKRWREAGNDHRIAIALLDLSHHTLLTGEYDEAERYIEEALDLSRAVGDVLRESAVLRNNGTLARRRGAYDRAADHYETARTLAIDIDNESFAAEVRADQGLLAYRRGEFERACEYCRDALDVLDDDEAHTEIAWTLRTLALATSALGDHEQALTHLDDAAQRFRDVDSEHGVASVTYARGVVERRRGNDQQARDAFEDAAETFATVGLAPGRARARRGLATVDPDPETAREELLGALETFLDIGAVDDAVETLSELADHDVDPARRQRLCDRLRTRAEELDVDAVADRVEAVCADVEGS